MNYNQTLDYLFSRLPMYQRIGAAAYKADLNNTIAICDALGNPQNKLKCVHIAGTNGKGSSSHMIAAVLQKAGYKTGLYTSPHLIDFRERIKINGKLISKEYIEEFVEKYKATFEKIEPSFFEWTVGLAFDYFLSQEVDIAVIEVGLGGRLDSTNVINPVISLITNISFDHTNLLGDTLSKIAEEKAGIIKPRKPVIVSEYQSETAPVFMNRARELKSPIRFGSKDYKVESHQHKNGSLEIMMLNKITNANESYTLDLTGSYQLKNLPGVLATINVISQNGFFIREENIKEGLSNVVKLTGIQGRWQILGEKPFVITDTGHNEDGIKEVLENFKRYKYKQLHFVLGVVNDKDVRSILKLLPKTAQYYFAKASVPRALDENSLKVEAEKHKLKGQTFPSVKEAVCAAKKSAKKDDLIFIGGSTFVVADVLKETL
jgi:dihydrofolate synthase / folylpolyglutamate synthase